MTRPCAAQPWTSGAVSARMMSGPWPACAAVVNFWPCWSNGTVTMLILMSGWAVWYWLTRLVSVTLSWSFIVCQNVSVVACDFADAVAATAIAATPATTHTSPRPAA